MPGAIGQLPNPLELIKSLLSRTADPQPSPQAAMSKPQAPVMNIAPAGGSQLPPGISVPQPPQPPVSAPQRDNGQMMEFLKRLGLPIASTIAGLASPAMLPGAAGFNTGFPAGMQKQEEINLEKDKIDYSRSESKKKDEKDKWDDSYRTAIELSKTGALGAIESMSPEQLDTLAGEVYKLRYGSSTEDIAKGVEDKYLGSNKGKGQGQLMTDANGNKAMVYPDGTFEEVK